MARSTTMTQSLGQIPTVLLTLFLAIACSLLEVDGSCAKGIVITGILDGKSGNPKGLEVYVLKTGDYDNWKIKKNSNGGSTWSTAYTFSGTTTAGSSYRIKTPAGVYTQLTRSVLLCFARSAPFAGYYFFTPHASTVGTGGWDWGRTKSNYNIVSDGSFNANGDDAYAVFDSADDLVDIYGQFQQDGTGRPWEYTNSWGYRKDAKLASTTWASADWIVAPVNSLENDADQQTTLTNAFGQYASSCTTGGSATPPKKPSPSPSDTSVKRTRKGKKLIQKITFRGLRASKAEEYKPYIRKALATTFGVRVENVVIVNVESQVGRSVIHEVCFCFFFLPFPFPPSFLISFLISFPSLSLSLLKISWNYTLI